MATVIKPSVIDTAVAAWRDAFSAIAAMPMTCGIAFVILVVLGWLSALLMPISVTPGLGTHVLAIVAGIVQAIFLAPLAIAVHRYVLLHEIALGYPLDLGNPRYQRFVGFAVLMNLLLTIPNMLMMGLSGGEENALGALWAIVGLVLLIVFLIMVLRRAILFPAIAVDAPGASWANARNDTKGNSWRVFFVFVCTAIPVIVISVPLYFLLLRPTAGVPTVGTGGQLFFTLISTVVQVPAVCAFAAAASHLFKDLADSLARPAAA